MPPVNFLLGDKKTPPLSVGEERGVDSSGFSLMGLPDFLLLLE